MFETHWPCHVSPNQHWCHPTCIHADSYDGYKFLVETSFPNSEGDRRRCLEKGRPCRQVPSPANLMIRGLTFLSRCRILITCGRTWIAHGESNDICEDETFQALSSWTVVLKGQGVEDLLTGGFLCYVPTLSNLINSQASNYHLQQDISACPCEAVKSPHYPSKNAI